MKKILIIALMVSFSLLTMVNNSFAVSKISVVSPNGGEVWHYGESQRIQWIATEDVKWVRIFVFDDSVISSGSTNYITQNNDAVSAELGYFDWTIEEKQLPRGLGQHFKINIVSADVLDSLDSYAVDISDNYFSIVPAVPPVPTKTPELGFPENGARVGIRDQSRGADKYYTYSIPVEIKGLAEKSIEIHINIAPEFQVEDVRLEFGLVEKKGWVMVSEIKPGNVHILAAGPRQIGDPHATSSIVYLFGKGAGKYQATINANIDGVWYYSASTFEYHMKGDINGDLIVDSVDAILILNYLLAQRTDAGETLTALEISIGDVNYNYDLDIDDAVGILQYTVGIITSIDSLSGIGAPPKTPKDFGVMIKEFAAKGVDPAAIMLLNQLTPRSGFNKLPTTWGKIKI